MYIRKKQQMTGLLQELYQVFNEISFFCQALCSSATGYGKRNKRKYEYNGFM